MLGLKRHSALGLLLALVVADASAQRGIYTCIDAKGRRLTSDRPIAECMDREQKELSPSGTVRRTHGPSLTATERAAHEAQERKSGEEKRRLAEELRKDKALLARYPNQAAHDRERAQALQTLESGIAEAKRRTADLEKQAKELAAETEFYKGDAAKYPAKLKRQIEDNQKQIAAQKRYLADQDAEKKRIEARFDEELAKLKVKWQSRAPAAATAAAPEPTKR